jgi:hypothetical protein
MLVENPRRSIYTLSSRWQHANGKPMLSLEPDSQPRAPLFILVLPGRIQQHNQGRGNRQDHATRDCAHDQQFKEAYSEH